MTKNVGASVLCKLKKHSDETGAATQGVLTRYAMERILWRIGESEYAHKFILKGGLMFVPWTGDLYRPTSDIDLNGISDSNEEDSDIESLKRMVIDICGSQSIDDGVSFDVESLTVKKSREGLFPGGKIQIRGNIGKAKVIVPIDVGFNNCVTPGAKKIQYPSLLEFPKPIILAYPQESTISEKLHAMVQHGIANTRLKDYYDIWALKSKMPFDGEILSCAIRNTFNRQERPLPALPDALTEVFYSSSDAQRNWKGFVDKSMLSVKPPALKNVVEEIAEFLIPVISAARDEGTCPTVWHPEDGWK